MTTASSFDLAPSVAFASATYCRIVAGSAQSRSATSLVSSPRASSSRVRRTPGESSVLVPEADGCDITRPLWIPSASQTDTGPRRSGGPHPSRNGRPSVPERYSVAMCSTGHFTDVSPSRTWSRTTAPTVAETSRTRKGFGRQSQKPEHYAGHMSSFPPGNFAASLVSTRRSTPPTPVDERRTATQATSSPRLPRRNRLSTFLM